MAIRVRTTFECPNSPHRRTRWRQSATAVGRYDHVFIAGDVHGPIASELPYEYPGVGRPCADPFCTGEDPPGNVTALYQGSWHRGWKVELTLES